jgi:radical SAM superfamily enzyme YgiQ (UPF0313 family)
LLLNALAGGQNASNNAAPDMEARITNKMDADSSGGVCGIPGISDISGVCFRLNGGIAVSPPHISADDPPDPYTDAYVKALNGRIAYLETSRGCSFSCAFCLSGREGRVRYFNMERAKNDLLRLSNSGTQTVKLVDRTFNADKKRALELFRFILDNDETAIPKGVRFHFELAGDLLDGETLALLSTAPKGLFQFEIGLQSFNEKTLEAVRRKTDAARLKENISRLISFGNIHIHIDLIAGLPFEDMERFERSFNTAYALSPHTLQLGFLKLLHGAAMRERPEEYPCEYAPVPPYRVLSTPWLTPDELRRLQAAEDALERLYNSGRFRRTLQYVLSQSGLTPFAFFMSAGAALEENAPDRESLDDYTARIFDYFGALGGVDRARLRDIMVCDRLATNSTGRLPQVLNRPDARIKAVLTAVNAERPIKKGVKRGFALLHAENAAVWADYTEKDLVTGEYALHKVPLSARKDTDNGL